MLKALLRIIVRCYRLARPYGRRKLALILLLLFINGLMQVAGATSVFPFFALAADPDRIVHSRLGSQILGYLPAMSTETMLYVAGALSIMLLLAANTISLASEIARMRYGHEFGHYLRLELMKSLSRRPYSFFLENSSSNAMQKVVGDVVHFINGLLLPLLDSLSRFLTLAFLLIAVFVIEPVLALTSAVVLFGSYLAFFILLRRRAHRLGEAIKNANRGTMSVTQEFLGGIKPILANVRSEFFINRFSEHSVAQARLFPLLPLYSNGPRYLIEPLIFGGLIMIVMWNAMIGRSLSDLLPSLSVIALAAYKMLPTVQLLYGQLTQVNAMRYTLEEIESEVGQDWGRKEVNAATPPQTNLAFNDQIQIREVTFGYPGTNKPILHKFSLVVQKNSSVGIVGTTGSGKSTLVDLILGLHLPDQGTISVDGRSIDGSNSVAWRKMIGYVPQDIFLLDASIAENVAFGIEGAEIDIDSLRAAAKAAQLLDFIEAQPKGWATMVGERGVRLSGGQRQRIGLARALYLKPQVLILDEATSALDVSTEADVMSAIDKIRGSLTIIIVAHRLTTIRGCQVVCRLGESGTDSHA